VEWLVFYSVSNKRSFSLLSSGVLEKSGPIPRASTVILRYAPWECGDWRIACVGFFRSQNAQPAFQATADSRIVTGRGLAGLILGR
jgi:hypothetical protein